MPIPLKIILMPITLMSSNSCSIRMKFDGLKGGDDDRGGGREHTIKGIKNYKRNT